MKLFCAPLLVSVLFLAFVTQLGFAAISTILGSGYQVEPIELQYATTLAQNIRDYSISSSFYKTVRNQFGTLTTAQNTYIAAGSGNPDNGSIVFYIGHGWLYTWLHVPPNDYHQEYQITMNDGSLVSDHQIYDNAHYHDGIHFNAWFIFLWSCHQGEEIGYLRHYSCGQSQPYGMPYAWLAGDTNLSPDGYANPDGWIMTFIGFNGIAPGLTDKLGGTDYAGFLFAREFYHWALTNGDDVSINDALDYASLWVWGVTYGSCILRTGYILNGSHGNMVVYGDGRYHLLFDYFPGGGGGGCPYLYVYDGANYACEGLLNIHNPEGIDVITNHTLTTTPKRTGGTYRMRLVEHPKTCSYIDQVKLYATLQNDITIQLPLVWAWHSENGFVLPQLLFSDEWKTETKGADWNNGTSQSIDLRFLALPPGIQVKAFTFQIEGNNPYEK